MLPLPLPPGCPPVRIAPAVDRWRQHGRSLVLLGLFLGGISFLHAQSSGTSDASFTAATERYGTINALAVQADGKIILGGFFEQVSGVAHHHIARLNVDGSLDNTFNTYAAEVNAVAVQPDGKIVLAGGFGQVNGVTHNHLARLNADGSLDPSFIPTVEGEVNSLAVQPDGKILLGGFFDHVNGAPRQFVARLNADGGLDNGFTASPSDVVLSVSVQPDGKVLLGGRFTRVNGAAHGLIARLSASGSLDRGFTAGASGSGGYDYVRTVALQSDGKILLGGNFTQVNGTGRNGIARLDASGSLDPGFNPGANDGTVATSLAVQPDGQIILAGFSLRVTDGTGDFVARLGADGRLDQDFATSVNGDVFSIVVQPDDRIILGGRFTQVNGDRRNGIVRVYGDATHPADPVVVSVAGNGFSSDGFKVSRTGSVRDPVTIFYHNGGGAVRNQDYVALPGSITIPAGQRESVIPVTVLAEAHRNRKLKVFLDPSPDNTYDIGKAQSKVFI